MIENFKLHVFRVVADALNFSKAAEELHISQPAVTSQVRTLEEGLGIALFDRVGRNRTALNTFLSASELCLGQELSPDFWESDPER